MVEFLLRCRYWKLTWPLFARQAKMVNTPVSKNCLFRCIFIPLFTLFSSVKCNLMDFWMCYSNHSKRYQMGGNWVYNLRGKRHSAKIDITPITSRSSATKKRLLIALKFEKIWFFGVKSYFSHEIPQKFSRLPPLYAIFLSAPPPSLTWNPGSAPAEFLVQFCLHSPQGQKTDLFK